MCVGRICFALNQEPGQGIVASGGNLAVGGDIPVQSTIPCRANVKSFLFVCIQLVKPREEGKSGN